MASKLCSNPNYIKKKKSSKRTIYEKAAFTAIKKNKDKKCKQMTPVFNVGEYKEYPHAEIRKLTSDEIKQYMSER